MYLVSLLLLLLDVLTKRKKERKNDTRTLCIRHDRARLELFVTGLRTERNLSTSHKPKGSLGVRLSVLPPRHAPLAPGKTAPRDSAFRGERMREEKNQTQKFPRVILSWQIPNAPTSSGYSLSAEAPS